MNDAPIGPDLNHPDAMIRLVSAVHRFQCPEMLQARKVSFSKSFKTVAVLPSTKELMQKADEARSNLAENIVNSRRKKNTPQIAVVQSTKEYTPFINSILLSCKIQSENARLDKRLIFEWASGLEQKQKSYSSEALMYELVMVIACEGMGTAGNACDDSLDGKFAVATRGFARAAGIFQHLAEMQLPKWISNGTSIESADLPAEVSVPVCDAFATYYLAVGQQMAVSTVLMKPGVPNYSLLAKLTKGIAELLEQFVSTMRSKASNSMAKMDNNFFILVTLQLTLQDALSLYFLARSLWDKESYGLAIAIMNEAIQTMKTRASIVSKGMPEIGSRSPLKALNDDLNACRVHLREVLTSWEKDNSRVYFDKVPTTVPEASKIAKGIQMIKPETFDLEEVDPVHLGPDPNVKKESTRRSDPPPPSYNSAIQDDEALARELQEKLNRGEID